MEDNILSASYSLPFGDMTDVIAMTFSPVDSSYICVPIPVSDFFASS